MDDDPVLRDLGADLERDDPDLAALLNGRAVRPPHHGHPGRWVLLALAVLLLAVLLPVTVTIGVIALALILSAPVIAWRWGAMADDLRPHHP
jgi:Flp pilus assembly protein TadB